MTDNNTLKAIEEAIAAHIAEVIGDGRMITDWFIGWAAVRPEEDGRMAYSRGYAASDSSPQAILGTAELCIEDLREGLSQCQCGECE
jgi:hypothetical protein